MKKRYFAPEMEIVKLEVQQILTGSIPVDGVNTTNDASGAEAPEHEWYDWQF